MNIDLSCNLYTCTFVYCRENIWCKYQFNFVYCYILLLLFKVAAQR